MIFSHLEEWIIEEYNNRNIHAIDDLSIENICLRFEVDLDYTNRNSKCFCDEDFRLILLKEDQPLENQRWDFFHELGHVLRHVGNQRTMPVTMVEYLEEQAHLFSLYASMPYKMMKPFLQLQVEEIAEVFLLPIHVISERLSMIQRQILLHDLEELMSLSLRQHFK